MGSLPLSPVTPGPAWEYYIWLKGNRSGGGRALSSPLPQREASPGSSEEEADASELLALLERVEALEQEGGRLLRLADLLWFSIQAPKFTLKELQSLVGHLNFACGVVTPGRPFLRRLYDALSGLRKLQH